MVRKVSHIAIAVPNVTEVAKFYEEKLGLKLVGREDVAGSKVTVGFIPVGETRLELVQPASPDSPISKFLETRGPGLQHVCFEVDDIAAELQRLEAAGVRLIDKIPRPGAHGTMVGFIHPSATGGVLVELSEQK
ncbi:methylmalonyl-CoA epimerase [candidate division WOR-3 bacterium]|uniref:Methylmalonyl-CoA epimerase n=1 Tax=candidate division WOR-3 bacterium TaxID=2052148 RepID=A0A937XFZ1_UNCW3|nr:methylmalonyl-CoA epimerase [candidate division WOR-3 bacterium]